MDGAAELPSKPECVFAHSGYLDVPGRPDKHKQWIAPRIVHERASMARTSPPCLSRPILVSNYFCPTNPFSSFMYLFFPFMQTKEDRMGRLRLKPEKRVKLQALLHHSGAFEELDKRTLRKLLAGERVNGTYIKKMYDHLKGEWETGGRDYHAFWNEFFVPALSEEVQTGPLLADTPAIVLEEGRDFVRALTDYPNAYPYFYRGRKLKSDTEDSLRNQVLALTARLLVFHMNILLHKPSMSEDVFEYWLSGSLVFYYSQSPIYREYIDTDPFYGELRQEINQYLHDSSADD